ncbi:MAG TPA: biotin-dependent carboxyltransferase [Desulfobacterales bacterium]|nr:biotin-dependent carboxyltransferase [Desulfobacterales bacterium]
MDALKILAPGGYTTVQDKGRYGYQQMGVPISGVLDAFAFQVANILVGNCNNAAVLEITVMGPLIEILVHADIALTGAEMGMTINDQPVQEWRSIRVKPGDILTIQQVKSGCRAYLAISGGIDVPEVMGSCSTYVGGKIGGFHGRPLKKGDVLGCKNAQLLTEQRRVTSDMIPEYPSEIVIRAIPGPQDNFFDEGLNILFSSKFMVTAKADRMGYRLQGPAIQIKDNMPKSIISEPSMPGAIQIPADEQPIILLVEQTMGGYAKIATVISSDLRWVAQTTPGDSIRFEKVNLELAHLLYIKEKKIIDTIQSIFSN